MSDIRLHYIVKGKELQVLLSGSKVDAISFNWPYSLSYGGEIWNFQGQNAVPSGYNGCAMYNLLEINREALHP